MLSNVSVVRVHSIHGLLSSLDELALQVGWWLAPAAGRGRARCGMAC
jgi:hypothetical protein